MDLGDSRLWYALAAVIVVILVLGYASGGSPGPLGQYHRRNSRS